MCCLELTHVFFALLQLAAKCNSRERLASIHRRTFSCVFLRVRGNVDHAIKSFAPFLVCEHGKVRYVINVCFQDPSEISRATPFWAKHVSRNLGFDKPVTAQLVLEAARIVIENRLSHFA